MNIERCNVRTIVTHLKKRRLSIQIPGSLPHHQTSPSRTVQHQYYRQHQNHTALRSLIHIRKKSIFMAFIWLTSYLWKTFRKRVTLAFVG
jgi:hypothetical protein